MASIITHRRIRIVTLAAGEAIADHCRPNDIALQEENGGWWTVFIGEDGQTDRYDAPFPSYNQALWAAKAAAEYAASGE